jgi:hypothetical protein
MIRFIRSSYAFLLGLLQPCYCYSRSGTATEPPKVTNLTDKNATETTGSVCWRQLLFCWLACWLLALPSTVVQACPRCCPQLLLFVAVTWETLLCL